MSQPYPPVAKHLALASVNRRRVCSGSPHLSCLLRLRASCQKVIAHKMFDHVVLVFIFLNCITIALERPDIDPGSTVSPWRQAGLLGGAGQGGRGTSHWSLSLQERAFLSVSNYIFTAIFVVEMMVKVLMVPSPSVLSHITLSWGLSAKPIHDCPSPRW